MQQRSRSLTGAGERLLNVLKSQCGISLAWDPEGGDPQPAITNFEAIWDTGATGCVITQKVVDACGLAPAGRATSFHAHGQTRTDVFMINVRLPNRVMFPGVRAIRGELSDNADILIGMDIINRGDFAVTNLNGKTKFSFRIPSLADIDFVREANEGTQPSLPNRAARRQKSGRRSKGKV